MKSCLDNLPTSDELILNIPGADSVELYDLRILCAAARKKRRVLEIGTRYARTTANLAKFCAPGGAVVTVDINQTDARKTLECLDPSLAEKIFLIEGDSHSLDYSELGPFDLVFIDGDHYPQGVAADTKAILPHLVTGALIVWHDYTSLPVLTGIKTLQIDHSQIGAYMGYSRGAHLNLPEGSLQTEMSIVCDFMSNFLEQFKKKEA